MYTCVLCVFSQGFTGKPGMEGPQGPVGMYVSDSSAGQIQGMHLYDLFTAYTECMQNIQYMSRILYQSLAKYLIK